MSEEYLKWHKKSGIKVGDKVRVLRVAKDFEMGWEIAWGSRMDDSVGKTFEVIDNNVGWGFGLDNGYVYPYFILQKVEEEVEVYKVVRKLRGRLMSCRACNFYQGIEYEIGEYVSTTPENIKANNLLAAFISYDDAVKFTENTGIGEDLIFKALAKGVSDILPVWPTPEGTIMCREIKLVEEVKEVKREQTYRIGDKFRQSFSGIIWGIINCSDSIPRVVLAQWKNGYLYNSAQKVKNIHHITQEEFSKICNGYENEFELIEEK